MIPRFFRISFYSLRVFPADSFFQPSGLRALEIKLFHGDLIGISRQAYFSYENQLFPETQILDRRKQNHFPYFPAPFLPVPDFPPHRAEGNDSARQEPFIPFSSVTERSFSGEIKNPAPIMILRSSSPQKSILDGSGFPAFFKLCRISFQKSFFFISAFRRICAFSGFL